jgi:hypothetical protein
MSLSKRLDAIREGAAKQIPAEVFAEMGRAAREIAESGIMNGVVQVGSRLPSFALTNQNEETMRSEELLVSGPLVLTVFRGSW